MIVDKDKKDDKMKTDGRTYRTAPGSLSPFEELVCAVVLAKPISHKLGVRSIAVLLNAPYKYTTPKALQSSTEEKRCVCRFARSFAYRLFGPYARCRIESGRD